MTCVRNDGHSTEFGLWLRNQDEIDSSLGYLATNIDYIWKNYNTNFYMAIEEKRKMAPVKTWQQIIFKRIDMVLSKDPFYKGFYILTFENTSPEDGRMFMRNIKQKDLSEITMNTLIDFLMFKTF